ncbi:MAG: MotA/TolQ/ExbB proton channel family protein [Lentisphaerae bacterium]|nr:MotA/TolQ/ExbB proton channel family protein [Lentisphaerota bacterium]MBT4823161.1 MotA/TolQ/ExbB proton channel family protein [Lentisphaerota bacterium]MBT5610451.1 MotA/TolQ/ExbB proton channel family protein [Lentisphaerota bacterium]MBT7061042.1 MotA/TolQ/ExbB proton channel family protein [Lentisphaerota bacterium]MBT7842173.1 MotA/TolQ/ExbB proton channel family protein [Lentisphaerota bacterium]
MVPLAAVAFLILQRYFSLHRRLQTALSAPEECVDALENRLSTGNAIGSVHDWLATLPGAVPRIARHVLARMEAGLSFHEAFRQCRAGEMGQYQHAFYVMGALVAAAPLLGLLGTVFGMIDTFHGVALRSGQTTDLVAGGISQALITTQVGLVAALPGTFGLAHLHRLYQRLTNEIDRCQSHLFMVVERME